MTAIPARAEGPRQSTSSVVYPTICSIRARGDRQHRDPDNVRLGA